MTSKEHPTATITTPNSTPGQSGRFPSESVAAFIGMRNLFLNARGRAMSTDGFAYILKQHVATAARKIPSIEGKRVTPHVLRHSTAMTILHATGDIRKVSLWLGHADIKTTEAYLRASPAEKLRILETNVPPSIRPGTFPGATDSLMRVLGGRGRLELMPSESGE